MAQDFTATEQELSAFYLSSLGLAAQRYEPSNGGTYDSNDAHLAKRSDRYRAEVARYRATELTLAQVEPSTRETLERVYGRPSTHSELLASTFRTSRGNSLVPLAIRAETARKAVSDAKHGTGCTVVLAWLETQMRKGDQAPRRLFQAIATECERTHLAALAEYETFRIVRIDRQRFEAKRIARERRDATNARLNGEIAPSPVIDEHAKRVSCIAELVRQVDVATLPPPALVPTDLLAGMA